MELPRLQGEVAYLQVQNLSRDEVIAEARDLYSRWADLAFEEKRQIVEGIVESITIGNDEVEIQLFYIPSPAEVAGKGQRNNTPALPFSGWTLRAAKPRLLPRGYPKDATTLGQQIRRWRMDLGLTQEGLARMLECSARSVSDWERDRVEPKAVRWPRLRVLPGDGIKPVGVPGQA